MKVFYSDKPLSLNLRKHSIFLAGPTPRDLVTPSWRVEALELLKELAYRGQVIVPERKVRVPHIVYEDQTEWEDYGLKNCSRIVFWIPRDLKVLPGFTTNVEFGRFAESARTLYGRPDDAAKVRYLDWLYKKYHQDGEIYDNLPDVLKAAIGFESFDLTLLR